MPQRLPRTGLTFHGAAHAALSAEPACVAGIGSVALAWTKIEGALVSMLATIFGAVPEAPTSDTAHSATVNFNRLAVIAVSQSDTIRARLNIIDALLEPLLSTSEHAEAWASLTGQLRSSGEQRNRIVHGNWMASDQLPGALAIVDNDPDASEIWTSADFDEAFLRLSMIENKVNRFADTISGAIRAGHLSVAGIEQQVVDDSAAENIVDPITAEDAALFTGDNMLEEAVEDPTSFDLGKSN